MWPCWKNLKSGYLILLIQFKVKNSFSRANSQRWTVFQISRAKLRYWSNQYSVLGYYLQLFVFVSNRMFKENLEGGKYDTSTMDLISTSTLIPTTNTGAEFDFSMLDKLKNWSMSQKKNCWEKMSWENGEYCI